MAGVARDGVNQACGRSHTGPVELYFEAMALWTVIARRNHHEGAGERPQAALSVCCRNSHRFAAVEARFRFGAYSSHRSRSDAIPATGQPVRLRATSPQALPNPEAWPAQLPVARAEQGPGIRPSSVLVLQVAVKPFDGAANCIDLVLALREAVAFRRVVMRVHGLTRLFQSLDDLFRFFLGHANIVFSL